MAEYEIKAPFSEEEIRKLHAGDIVYISGDIMTLRDMAYSRTLEAIDAGKNLPFELKDRAIWHAGPITRPIGDNKWEAVCVGSTTSSRFTSVAAELIRKSGLRVIIGKGLMGKATQDALQKFGGVYVVTTGGAAAYYGDRIKEVKDVHWLDLGMPAACWEFKADRIGPLTVAIDSHGNCIFDQLEKDVDERIDNILDEYKVDKNHNYLWWPKP